MNKKAIILSLAMFVFSASSVYAMDVTKTDAKISVGGVIEANSNVRLNVTDNNGEIIWLDSENADDEGKYDIDFVVPFDDSTIEYTLCINGTDIETVTVKGTSDIIKELSNATASDFKEKFTLYADRFGYDVSIFDGLTKKDGVFPIFKSCELKTADDVKSAYYKACSICAINEGDRGDALELLEKYSEYIAPSFKSDMNTLTKKQQEAFAIAIASEDYNSVSSFEKGYAAALKSAKEENKPTPIGGGGGGGSTSGGRGGYVPSKPADENQNPDNNEKDPETHEIFNDISNVPWAKESIEKLYKNGVIKGKSEGVFAPNDSVLREEFVAMIIRQFGFTGNEKSSFEDVADNAWYKDAVDIALENGVINGVSENKFGSGRAVTRGECAAMCARVLDKIGVSADLDSDEELFADDNEFPEYAKDGIYKLKKLGILSGMGDNRFCANEVCTRAMTAKIIDLLGECKK